MTICKNCAQEFEGNYCPECGQKASTKRYTLKIAFNELVKKLLPLEKGFLFTARNLLLHPGIMLREFLDGKRVNYTKPFHFLFYISAISIIFFSRNQFDQSFQAGFGAAKNEAVARIQNQVLEFVFSHISIFFLLLTPFLAFFFRLFFRKSDLNYAEHLVLSSYLMAGCSLVSMPFTILLLALGQNPYLPVFTSLVMGVYLAYLVWAFTDFIQPKNKWLVGFKVLLAYLLAYLVYILFFSIFVGLGVVIYVWIWGVPK